MPRPAGTPNRDKKQLLRALQKVYPEYSPLEELIKISLNPETSVTEQISCHKEVAQYLYPKLKAVEQSVDMTINVPKSIAFKVKK